MAVNSREVKRRIKSVKNIGQITKAMELVSAAKMRKAQALATSSRPYAVLSTELLKNVASKADVAAHPLVNRPAGKASGISKTLIVFVTSDRGLAGSFNSNAINKALKMIKESANEEFEFITVGKKGADFVKRIGKKIVANFPVKDKGITIFDAKAIVQIAAGDFLNYTYGRVLRG